MRAQFVVGRGSPQEMVAGLGRKFFKLFQHPSLAIVKGAGLLMRTIIDEAPDHILRDMQVRDETRPALGCPRARDRVGLVVEACRLCCGDGTSSQAQS